MLRKRLIKNSKTSPFIIGIFCGTSKPKPLPNYLSDFVTELKELLVNGFEYNNRKYAVEIHSFVCDSPAKAFIKCVKSHGGYSSCDKCHDPGEYYCGRVTLKNIFAPKRTDRSFRLQLDEEHHVGETPLLVLPIDFIACFPIDYMHCICLGVVRKLLNSWLSGPLHVRLGNNLAKQISD
ncbi:uncharacterized protein LOC135143826 [Zophobas morio]|uniref:uncharacterized protein LOC135143826 n=1 Tax=Zophobas morio TaxID=2755281 RepID=UPI003082DB0F